MLEGLDFEKLARELVLVRLSVLLRSVWLVLADLPIPIAAADDESVLVTAAIRCFADETGRVAFGACKGRSPAILACFACSSGCGVMLSYSLPSWPIEGRVTEGGRAIRSRPKLLPLPLCLFDPLVLLGEAYPRSLSGERAKVSLLGLTLRSTLRLGRAGICGVSWVFEGTGKFPEPRAGRGGIDGAAMIDI